MSDKNRIPLEMYAIIDKDGKFVTSSTNKKLIIGFLERDKKLKGVILNETADMEIEE